MPSRSTALQRAPRSGRPARRGGGGLGLAQNAEAELAGSRAQLGTMRPAGLLGGAPGCGQCGVGLLPE